MKTILLLLLTVLSTMAWALPKLAVPQFQIVRQNQGDTETAAAITGAEVELTQRLAGALANTNKYDVSLVNGPITPALGFDLVLSGKVLMMTFSVQRNMDMTVGRMKDIATSSLVLQYQLTNARTNAVIASDIIPLSTAPLDVNLTDGITVDLRTKMLNALTTAAAAQINMAADPIRIASSQDYSVNINRGTDARLIPGQHLDVMATADIQDSADASGVATQYVKFAELEIISVGPNASTCKLVMPPDVSADYLTNVPALIQPGMICRTMPMLDPSGAIIVAVQ